MRRAEELVEGDDGAHTVAAACEHLVEHGERRLVDVGVEVEERDWPPDVLIEEWRQRVVEPAGMQPYVWVDVGQLAVHRVRPGPPDRPASAVRARRCSARQAFERVEAMPRRRLLVLGEVGEEVERDRASHSEFHT
eukprot:2407400-Prymnesium_polylepis.2